MGTESFEDQWIANLDVLGMSVSMMNAERREVILRSYLDFARTRSQGLKPRRGDFGSDGKVLAELWAKMQADALVLFSDSIFFRFLGSSQQYQLDRANLRSFSLFVVEPFLGLLAWAWKNGLPVRGALSYGAAHVAVDLNIIVGPAVVRSVRWQEVQEWPWVSLDPKSAQLVLPMLDASQDVLVPYDVPTKNGPVSSYALSPSLLAPNDIERLIDLWRIAQKEGMIAHTRKWVNLIKFCLNHGCEFPQITSAERHLLT